jgi:hypothetical protein
VTADCRQDDDPVVPPPGALRPLARALLSVAAEIHAARHDPLGLRCQVRAGPLGAAKKGVVHPGVSGVVSGVLSPATPERTPSGDVSSQVNGAPPPPVVKPDSMGDCA